MRTTLLKKYMLLALLVSIAFSTISFAQKRELAITIDDLPFVGESKNFHLNMIINAFKTSAIPATGFIIAREVNQHTLQALRKFHNAGLGLGNHTLSHANLNKMTTDAYIHEIEAADKILSPILTEPKYFRYPYLVMGEGHKKNSIMQYLLSKNYQVAPISIDSKDFIFNQLLLSVPQNERRSFLAVLKPCYLEFIWQQTLKAEEHNRYNHKPDQAQILLIHANLLNAYVLPDIINLYKQNGFNFVSLEYALKPPGEDLKPSATVAQIPIESSSNEPNMAWE